jgi:hypothetical protein
MAMEMSSAFNPRTQMWTVHRLRGNAGRQRLVPWVEVRPSRILNAGDGVFASRNFKKDAVIGYYVGAVCRDMKDMPSSGMYSMESATGVIIDGSRCGNWTCKINDGSVGKGHGCNISFSWDKLKIIATRNIRKGDELLGPYGDGYWKSKPPP